MTALEQLQALAAARYPDKDGAEYPTVLLQALSAAEVDALAQQFPAGRIPDAIRQLLMYARGFEWPGFDDVTFDGIGQFGLESIFPFSVQLTGDGLGNFWIVDVDGAGNWGPVFFVCHDPAVVVRQAESLAAFIAQVAGYLVPPAPAKLETIRDEAAMRAWEYDDNLVEVPQARNSGDAELRAFATGLPDHFVLADLRGKPDGAGFAWGRYGTNVDSARRYGAAHLWAFDRPVKRGLLSRLLGRR